MPLGVIADRQQLLSYARQQAAVTQNTATGIASNCACALAAHVGYTKLAELDTKLLARFNLPVL